MGDCFSPVRAESCYFPFIFNCFLGGIISTIDVELEIFQDQENGFREWNMEENVLCLGCQSQSFHDVRIVPFFL